MDGEPVAKLSIAPRSRDDARIAAHLDTFARRVEATPPGMCPLAVQLTMLQASGAQTCGKCVPCRDGIPQLAAMLKRVVDCDADEGVLEGLRALAEMIRDTSDCAIGYEAARSVLEGLDTFADEYASHVHVRVCQAGVGQTVPCETLCPAHVDVPAYIALTAAGDYAGAVNMVRKDNPFPTACAFVCEHPCETRCRRTLIDAPINIRGIKKFAVDQMPADQVAPPPRSVDTARTVAVIGGGPSGLTCAYFLALMGHRVTVFEERAQLGGMLRYGIPAYRFPRERLDEDIRGILNAGTITARCGEAVGAHEMAEIADTYHAVYVSIGAQTGKSLRIDGVDAEGVVSAVDLLGAIGDGDYPDFTGKRVVVVGGGNVAMDCARTSVRAGADEVSVVYRRRKDDMTALPAEVESAIAEGVEMIPEVERFLRDCESQLNIHHRMVLCYKIACLYFGNGDHRKCMEYLGRIIGTRDPQIRRDLQCYARILNLIASYEAGIDYNLDYQVRSVYLFLIKMNDMQQVQRAIMAFLKRLNSMYETTLKDELRQLYRRLKPLEHHPYERRTFYYLDILSWLESKLKGVPVAEVIRQRFLQQNGR